MTSESELELEHFVLFDKYIYNSKGANYIYIAQKIHDTILSEFDKVKNILKYSIDFFNFVSTNIPILFNPARTQMNSSPTVYICMNRNNTKHFDNEIIGEKNLVYDMYFSGDLFGYVEPVSYPITISHTYFDVCVSAVKKIFSNEDFCKKYKYVYNPELYAHIKNIDACILFCGVIGSVQKHSVNILVNKKAENVYDITLANTGLGVNNQIHMLNDEMCGLLTATINFDTLFDLIVSSFIQLRFWHENNINWFYDKIVNIFFKTCSKRKIKLQTSSTCSFHSTNSLIHYILDTNDACEKYDRMLFVKCYDIFLNDLEKKKILSENDKNYIDLLMNMKNFLFTKNKEYSSRLNNLYEKYVKNIEIFSYIIPDFPESMNKIRYAIPLHKEKLYFMDINFKNTEESVHMLNSYKKTTMYNVDYEYSHLNISYILHKFYYECDHISNSNNMFKYIMSLCYSKIFCERRYMRSWHMSYMPTAHMSYMVNTRIEIIRDKYCLNELLILMKLCLKPDFKPIADDTKIYDSLIDLMNLWEIQCFQINGKYLKILCYLFINLKSIVLVKLSEQQISYLPGFFKITYDLTQFVTILNDMFNINVNMKHVLVLCLHLINNTYISDSGSNCINIDNIDDNYHLLIISTEKGLFSNNPPNQTLIKYDHYFSAKELLNSIMNNHNTNIYNDKCENFFKTNKYCFDIKLEDHEYDSYFGTDTLLINNYIFMSYYNINKDLFTSFNKKNIYDFTTNVNYHSIFVNNYIIYNLLYFAKLKINKIILDFYESQISFDSTNDDTKIIYFTCLFMNDQKKLENAMKNQRMGIDNIIKSVVLLLLRNNIFPFGFFNIFLNNSGLSENITQDTIDGFIYSDGIVKIKDKKYLCVNKYDIINNKLKLLLEKYCINIQNNISNTMFVGTIKNNLNIGITINNNHMNHICVYYDGIKYELIPDSDNKLFYGIFHGKFRNTIRQNGGAGIKKTPQSHGLPNRKDDMRKWKGAEKIRKKEENKKTYSDDIITYSDDIITHSNNLENSDALIFKDSNQNYIIYNGYELNGDVIFLFLSKIKSEIYIIIENEKIKFNNSNNVFINSWMYDLQNVFLLENNKFIIFEKNDKFDTWWNKSSIVTLKSEKSTDKLKAKQAYIITIINNGIDLDFHDNVDAFSEYMKQCNDVGKTDIMWKLINKYKNVLNKPNIINWNTPYLYVFDKIIGDDQISLNIDSILKHNTDIYKYYDKYEKMDMSHDILSNDDEDNEKKLTICYQYINQIVNNIKSKFNFLSKEKTFKMDIEINGVVEKINNHLGTHKKCDENTRKTLNKSLNIIHSQMNVQLIKGNIIENIENLYNIINKYLTDYIFLKYVKSNTNFILFIKSEKKLFTYFLKLNMCYVTGIDIQKIVEKYKEPEIRCNEAVKIFEKINEEIIYLDHTDDNIVIFELYFGYFIKKKQHDLYKTIIEENKFPKIHQLLMGQGKSSVIVPLLTIKNIKNKTTIIIITKDTLVEQTFDTMIKYSPIYGDIRVSKLSNFNTSTEEFNNLFTKKNKNIIIISDTVYKSYILWTLNKSVTYNLDDKYFIIDEFDSIYDPLSSSLNISNITSIQDIKSLMKPKFSEDENIEDLFGYIVESIWALVFNKDKYDEIGTLYSTKINSYIFNDIKGLIVKCINDNYYNKDYGFSTVTSHELTKKYVLDDKKYHSSVYYAVPYAYSNTPVNNSHYSDVRILMIMTVLLHFMSLKELGFNYIHFINILYYFKHNPHDIQIKELNLGLNYEQVEKLDLYDNTKISHIYEKVKDTAVGTKIIPCIKLYLLKIILLNIKVNTKIENCTTMDIINNKNMKFKSGFSGTVNIEMPVFNLPISKTQYTHEENEFSNEIIPDDEAMGEIYYSILRNDNNGEIEYINMTKDSDQNIILSDILNIIKDKYDCFIDLHGLLRNKTSYDVAKKIAESFKHKIYVIFIDENDMIKVIENNTKIIKYERQVYPQGQLFIYYDNKHTVGIDIKQPYELNGLLSVELKADLTQISQAIFRLRNINRGHTVNFLVNVAEQEKLKNRYDLLRNAIENKDLYLKQSRPIKLEQNILMHKKISNNMNFTIEPFVYYKHFNNNDEKPCMIQYIREFVCNDTNSVNNFLCQELDKILIEEKDLVPTQTNTTVREVETGVEKVTVTVIETLRVMIRISFNSIFDEHPYRYNGYISNNNDVFNPQFWIELSPKNWGFQLYEKYYVMGGNLTGLDNIQYYRTIGEIYYFVPDYTYIMMKTKNESDIVSQIKTFNQHTNLREFLLSLLLKKNIKMIDYFYVGHYSKNQTDYDIATTFFSKIIIADFDKISILKEIDNMHWQTFRDYVVNTINNIYSTPRQEQKKILLKLCGNSDINKEELIRHILEQDVKN